MGLAKIQLTLSLAVITLLLGGLIILLYGNVLVPGKVYSAARDLMNLAAAVKAVHPRSDYSALGASAAYGAEILVNSGKAPPAMVNGNRLAGLHGVQVDVRAADYGTGTSSAFLIVYPQIPPGDCSELVSLSESIFFRVVVVNATSQTSSAGDLSEVLKDLLAPSPVEFSVNRVSAACSHSLNTIYFTGI